MTGGMLRLGLAAALLATAGPTWAQPVASSSPQAAAEARFGIVRVRIDPQVGEQEAEIRQLLAAHSFVQIGEPADFLITTQADLPLDLAIVDLRQPRQHWDELDCNFKA